MRVLITCLLTEEHESVTSYIVASTIVIYPRRKVWNIIESENKDLSIKNLLLKKCFIFFTPKQMKLCMGFIVFLYLVTGNVNY